MKHITDTLPTLSRMEERLEERLLAVADRLAVETAPYRRLLLWYGLGSVISLVGIVAVYWRFIAPSRIHTSVYVMLILCFVGLLFSVNRYTKIHQALAKQVNLSLLPVLIETFDRNILYLNSKEHHEATKTELDKSALMTAARTTVVSDDVYTLYGEYDLVARELEVTQRQGKQRVNLFKGLFVTMSLDRLFSGSTYISTEGDTHGFAHKDFFTELFQVSKVEETVLEWNDFERDLHVATNNPTEAREILTPDFMQLLHTWWSDHRRNIRIAFSGSTMFMLLPEPTIKIKVGIYSATPKALKSYLLSIARPLWITLALTDTVARSK